MRLIQADGQLLHRPKRHGRLIFRFMGLDVQVRVTFRERSEYLLAFDSSDSCAKTVVDTGPKRHVGIGPPGKIKAPQTMLWGAFLLTNYRPNRRPNFRLLCATRQT